MDKLKPFIEVRERPQPNYQTLHGYKPEHGWGNGYVHLPPGHKWHGIDYDNLSGVEVHGGLTYSKWDSEHINWIIGFDTGHTGDTLKDWPKERVIEETENLLKQCL